MFKKLTLLAALIGISGAALCKPAVCKIVYIELSVRSGYVCFRALKYCNAIVFRGKPERRISGILHDALLIKACEPCKLSDMRSDYGRHFPGFKLFADPNQSVRLKGKRTCVKNDGISLFEEARNKSLKILKAGRYSAAYEDRIRGLAKLSCLAQQSGCTVRPLRKERAGLCNSYRIKRLIFGEDLNKSCAGS